MGGWGLGGRARGWGFDPHLGHYVVSLGKTNLLPQNTGNTQEVKFCLPGR